VRAARVSGGETGGRAHFYYRDPTAPEPTHPRTLGVIGIIERDGAILLERRTDAPLYRVASFVYSIEVVSFDGLRVSSESEELRFFPKSELRDVEFPATQRPIVERLLSGHPPPHFD